MVSSPPVRGRVGGTAGGSSTAGAADDSAPGGGEPAPSSASVLAASVVETDDDGVARVGLTAGQSVATFRVEARAELAAAALFFVTVSDQGFATLTLVPRHLREARREETR